ncbi:MFS transporter [Uliginosibacterium sp. H3]|uniref:MFS transporter n=1 Tax=Uliginosibacterium silvisoli TaxID=3114758 RepID=A0ABU6K131_9RHOO|nr:MFS transporter [Uliginosibacterium sp. H3]
MQSSRRSFVSFAIVFFCQYCALGMWTVPFSNILKAAGLQDLIGVAFTCNAIACFISPLFVGAMADRGVSPIKLLRVLFWLAGICLGLVFLAVDRGWGGLWVLVCMQLYALAYSPTTSLVTTVALQQLREPTREFGPLRLWATLGWIAAGLLVSWVLAGDASPISGFVSAAILFGLGTFSFWLPPTRAGTAGVAHTWKERLGLDALRLLRHRDHRAVLLTVTLFGIPMAAYYPYTPLHLSALGFDHPAATMTLGQVSEAFALLLFARVAQRTHLKAILATGLLLGAVRFALFAFDQRVAMLLGISLHGVSYAFYFITAQIYLAERIEPDMRARAQALFGLLSGGVANLIGYLGTSALFHWTGSGGAQNWFLYWSVISAAAFAAAVYFMLVFDRHSRE